jgi:hypothetical protein
VENYSVAVSNAHAAETEVHTLLHQYRLHPKREFFRVDLATVKAIFDQVAKMDAALPAHTIISSTHPIIPQNQISV